MSSDPLADWWTHPVSIRRRLGSGSHGDVVEAEPGTDYLGAIDDRRKLVLAASGDQVISETSVYLPINTPAVPLDSLVALPVTFGTGWRRVIAVSRHDGGGQPTPDHLELSLA